MYVKEVVIQNFKCYKHFEINLDSWLNIIVWDNETWKSTLLEAIHLALSGWIYGRYLGTELTESLFNRASVKEYIQSLKTGNILEPPRIIIELYFEKSSLEENDSIFASLEWNFNSKRKNASWIRFEIGFQDDPINNYYYELWLSTSEGIKTLPIEFYDFKRSAFSRDKNITPKTLLFKSVFIDWSSWNHSVWSDMYVSRIVREFMTDEDKIKTSQAFRKLNESFIQDIGEVNQKISTEIEAWKQITLSVSHSTKNAREGNVVTYIDDVPFGNIGKWEQCILKTKIALTHKKSREASILLLEEPENHLSHSKLNSLIETVERSSEKQLIISTHSSYVANKLWLEKLNLLSKDAHTKEINKCSMKQLTVDTYNYFKKLPWYDTLRLILCRKAILVEWDCDELIVQKAYLNYYGKLPIQDCIDTISVRSLAFLRFLEISKLLKHPTVVITDNDGNFKQNVSEKYKEYSSDNFIKICADQDDSYSTLEPQIVKANQSQLWVLNEILWVKLSTSDEFIEYMTKKSNKVKCALKIFESDAKILFPKYILEAIEWLHG